VVSVAEQAGLITPDHVKVLREVISRLPGFVDTTGVSDGLCSCGS
jgi:hypothetical protein